MPIPAPPSLAVYDNCRCQITPCQWLFVDRGLFLVGSSAGALIGSCSACNRTGLLSSLIMPLFNQPSNSSHYCQFPSLQHPWIQLGVEAANWYRTAHFHNQQAYFTSILLRRPTVTVVITQLCYYIQPVTVVTADNTCLFNRCWSYV